GVIAVCGPHRGFLGARPARPWRGFGRGGAPARPVWGENLSYDLLLNAVTAGILLGGFYAAVTVGISIAFGILDIVNIAHPAFIILGAYVAYLANTQFGIDPIVASIIALPVFYGLGALLYQVYHLSFEKRGQESQDSLR